MKIYSMTATFGKLNHETLTLKPGLNIIEAPNEWGKSTWCAFLTAMLYGIDTRAKTTKTVIADKERYAPWSGAPMEGRIDLNWNGRDITIERRSKGRLIFGDFRAYETKTGLNIPEMDGANCGQMLLGVERSVFLRAGFLRLGDLPVTQDDALRRRLNNLVTTGDESGAGDKLGKNLKDLKNRCRYNQKGLLPEAEAQKQQLERQLEDLRDLRTQEQRLQQRQQELDTWVARLENHKTALAYELSQGETKQVAEAAQKADDAGLRVQQLEEICKELPSEAATEQELHKAQSLQQEWMSLQMESQMLPKEPQAPTASLSYQGMTPKAAVEQARRDQAEAAALEKRKKGNGRFIWIFAALALLVQIGVAALYFACRDASWRLPVTVGAEAAVVLGGILTAIACAVRAKSIAAEIETIYLRHPGKSPDAWLPEAQEYEKAYDAYLRKAEECRALRGDVDQRLKAVSNKISGFAEGGDLQGQINHLNSVLSAWKLLADANRDLQQAASHADTVRAMAKPVRPPEFPDTLAYSKDETNTLIANAVSERQQNQRRLGQFQGQAEALGQEENLRSRLNQVKSRIDKLEDTYMALELAQKALSQATGELQRRFAPRITKRAQELFSDLTGGRYQRLALEEDLSLSVSTQQEDTLRTSLWRSDGTVDQLYLALRLAVAEELTPEAPLVLDDALVRFDDVRLRAAMDILRKTAENKQVIVFTCQAREKNA